MYQSDVHLISSGDLQIGGCEDCGHYHVTHKALYDFDSHNGNLSDKQLGTDGIVNVISLLDQKRNNSLLCMNWLISFLNSQTLFLKARKKFIVICLQVKCLFLN